MRNVRFVIRPDNLLSYPDELDSVEEIKNSLTSLAACARSVAMGITMSEQPRLFDVPEEAPLSRRDKKRQKHLNPVSPALVLQVWELWVETYWTGRGRRPLLTDERTKLITVAINQHGVDVVKQAVRGCSLSPWHMGQNPSGAIYNSIELILRDANRIERFASLASTNDNAGGFLDEE